MEEHFLDVSDLGEPAFSDEPWYNPDGDCVICVIANEATVSKRVDEILTIYNSAVDNRPIGYQIKGVTAIIKRFGWDGLAVATQRNKEAQCIESVSLAALLLAAYEIGPQTLGRRSAYASVMERSAAGGRISKKELAYA